jgi:3-methyladenine DNA glycosylase/8-oxoguanine DNA glycosylase
MIEADIVTRWKNLYTIGHSTRSIDDFIATLQAFDISVLVDIRTIPRSRHNPQFEGAALRRALRSHGIRYTHLAALGGLRRTRPDSPNTAWRNASFRGYADYMQTPEFARGLDALHALSETGTAAIMCAEAVPWRCHRSLVADALTVRGARVSHIAGADRSSPHRMTAFARVDGTRLTYPGTSTRSVRDPRKSDKARKLATRAPFHLEATVRVLQRRSTNLVERWEDGRYLRVIATRTGLVLVEVTNRGTIDAPDVRYTILDGKAPARTRAKVEQTLRIVLGLDVDPEPLARLAESEPSLQPEGAALRGMRPPRFADLFEAFANVIPFQQVSLDAGIAVVGRLVKRYGKTLDHDGEQRHAFPTAETIARARMDALRACGLSATKAGSLQHIARLIVSGTLTDKALAKLGTDDALAMLGELPGIGPWSAALVLLRGLGRLDVFPPGDVGVARGLGTTMEKMIRRFGDRRGYLYFCSLGRSLLAKDAIHPAPERLAVRRTARVR